MNRHQMRRSAFMLVFEKIFIDDSLDEIISDAQDSAQIELNDDVISLFKGTVENTVEIDKIISEYLKNWTINRISKVSLAVLRLAVYELTYCEDIPDSVVINEAVEITKEFSTKDDSAFVNGVLGSFVRDK